MTVLLLLIVVQTPSGQAADVLWYSPPPPGKSQSGWLPQPFRRLTGSVRSFQSGKIEIVVGDERGELATRSVTSDRVVWVEPDWAGQGAQVQQAFLDFQRGNYDACLLPLSDYVKSATVRWRQQIAYGCVMFAASRRGKHRSALRIAAGFHDSQPPDFMYSLLPIHWTSQPPNSTRDRVAADALVDANPAVRLIAASWLLSGARRAQAEEALGRIASEGSHPLLAKLAYVLRWRTATGPSVKQQASRWEAKVHQLPIALQGGPLTTIADRLQASGFDEAALLQWLKVAHLSQSVGTLAPDAAAKAQAIADQLAKDAVKPKND